MKPQEMLQDFSYLERADIDACLEYAAPHAAYHEIPLSSEIFVDANLSPRLCAWLKSR